MRKNKKPPRIYYTRPRQKDEELKILELKLQKERLELEKRRNDLDNDRKLVEDTIHEFRKINNQIKRSAYRLSRVIESISVSDESLSSDIENTMRTLSANASLLSIRMDSYDMVVNPSSLSEEMEAPLCVYSKVEKVYKCLYSTRVDKGVNINLEGKSTLKFQLKSTIEIAFFIILENAIKYSPRGEEIKVTFTEKNRQLIVVFKNYGIAPSDSELPRLTERGYRALEIVRDTNIRGSGLGLYLLDQICWANKVAYSIKKGTETKTIGGQEYSPFIVALVFS